MAQAEDKNKPEEGVPDTTQKKDGTTSAFSAASDADNAGSNTTDEQSEYRKNGEQGRASFHPGSTTQGGSNYGQGSGSLGPSSYQQGSEQSKGTNYENEVGRFAETGTQADGEDDAPETPPAKQERKDGNDSKEDTIGIP